MPKKEDEEVGGVAVIIVIIVVALALFWTYVVEPLELWWKTNGIWVEIAILVIVVVGGYAYYRWHKWNAQIERETREKRARDAEERRRLEEQQREADRVEQERKDREWRAETERLAEENRRFEEEQEDKGLVKFVSEAGVVYWGTPSQVEDWRKAEFEQSLPNRVVQAIGDFEPSRHYHNEFPYQVELQGWLKSRFPTSKIETQTGASTPDIVIEDIAIEVKGPTDNRALDTLTTKCLKYSQYYSKIILVLFEPEFSESNFREIEAGIQQHFPHVHVIRKH